jgi:5-oxoprolinase (ATP-hydrolysing) subunit C
LSSKRFEDAMSTPQPIGAVLKVLHPGLCTLVVDHGRPHCRSLGVPVGGAADRAALAVGNALVGNKPDAAALEVALAGPTLVADAELACVLYGAPFDLSSDRQPLSPGKTFTLQPGEILRIGGTAHDVRAYFCVRGGFQTPILLDSRSSLAPLRAGAELPCLSGTIRPHFILLEPARTAPAVVRVLSGAQAGWFPAEDFYTATFTVTPASNRMGLRLNGIPLPVPQREMVSEPVCPGTVQVTREGQCIVLGVDGQTIGGYPKIAHVIDADLDLLGQLRPGECVVFRRTTLAEAERLYREKQARLREWLKRLRAADASVP